MLYAYGCIMLSILLQIFDYLYHKKDLSYIKFDNSEATYEELRLVFKHLSSKKLDKYFVVLPFIWSYLYIITAIIMFHSIDLLVIRVLLILFVSGRMRSLQEIGHFAVHGALCPNLKLGMFITNILYQFPTFMPEVSVRRKTHVLDHHHSVNMTHDPDLQELVDKGLKLGISTTKFWIGLFYYLTPSGIVNRLKECWGYLTYERFSLNFFLRLFVVTIIVSSFILLELHKELLFLYILPVLVVYPLFYWLAHVALHRWFVDCDNSIEYYQRELEIGRPTNFTGILGFIIRHNLFPVGDSYHLAHSLFPVVRWTHLPQVDKILKKYCKKYNENASFGLFFSTNNYPSTFSELRERMTT